MAKSKKTTTKVTQPIENKTQEKIVDIQPVEDNIKEVVSEPVVDKKPTNKTQSVEEIVSTILSISGKIKNCTVELNPNGGIVCVIGYNERIKNNDELYPNTKSFTAKSVSDIVPQIQHFIDTPSMGLKQIV